MWVATQSVDSSFGLVHSMSHQLDGGTMSALTLILMCVRATSGPSIPARTSLVDADSIIGAALEAARVMMRSLPTWVTKLALMRT